MPKIEVLDTTLRDGLQCEGVSLSLEDKLRVAHILDELGIPLIEAGAPAYSPLDAAFFEQLKSEGLKAEISAFCGTARKEFSPDKDPSLLAVLGADTPMVTIFGKSSALHAEKVIGCTKERNLELIYGSVRFFADAGKRVIFDAEHFFDGFAADPNYAMRALEAAQTAGADILCLCDTNGGSLPSSLQIAVGEAVARFGGAKIGIHTHNDAGLAVANAYFALTEGARHAQGTLIGIGERAGNCNLSTLIPTMQLKTKLELLPKERLPLITSAALALADTFNLSLPASSPYVGAAAFSHKAGTHADAVLKMSGSFEQVPPEAVGNTRHFPLSSISGRHVLLEKLKIFYPDLDKEDERTKRILNLLKESEMRGYSYESAEASFFMAVKKAMGDFTPHFTLVGYKTIGEQPAPEDTTASCLVKIRVGERTQIAAAEGIGPVHALDKALRAALSDFYPAVSEMSLTDYKVRVLTPEKATAALVRVLVTSTDGRAQWSTAGVSCDVIEASFHALVDSIEYKLSRE